MLLSLIVQGNGTCSKMKIFQAIHQPITTLPFPACRTIQTATSKKPPSPSPPYSTTQNPRDGVPRTHIAQPPAQPPYPHPHTSARPLQHRHQGRRTHQFLRQPLQGRRQRCRKQDPRFLPLQEQAGHEQQSAVPVLYGGDYGRVDGCGGKGYGSRYVVYFKAWEMGMRSMKWKEEMEMGGRENWVFN